MSNAMSFLMGMAFGAGLMYLADPQNGRRRRAVARDKALALARDAAECGEKKARHLRNRAYGTAIEARKAVVGSA